MNERVALGLLRLLCTMGPQRLADVDRGGVDSLIARRLATLTKRGLAVGATTQGYALHKATAPVGNVMRDPGARNR
jgi:hypothetical protein